MEELHKLCSSRSLNVISYRNKIPVFKIKSHVICNIETLQVNLLLYLFRVLVKAYNGFSQHFFLQCIHIVQLPSALFDAGSGNSILPSDWLIGKSMLLYVTNILFKEKHSVPPTMKLDCVCWLLLKKGVSLLCFTTVQSPEWKNRVPQKLQFH